MAMGIVSDKDFGEEAKRLNIREQSSTTFPSLSEEQARIQEINRGRGDGNTAVPDSLRKVIGETAITAGRQEAIALAREFGISQASADAYAHGSTSLASYDKQPNLEHINSAKARVSKKARSKLMLALSAITKDKVTDLSVRDAAGVAKDMSVVMKNMETNSPTGGDDKKTPQYIIYAPQFRDERSYEIVNARE